MLWLYLAGSVAGIALMVGINVLLFGARPIKIASIDVAAERLRNEIAGFRLGESAVGTSQDVALAEDARDGSLHLIVVRGDGLVARALKKGMLKTVSRDGAALSLRFADFTLPHANLTLSNEAAAQHWEARIARAA